MSTRSSARIVRCASRASLSLALALLCAAPTTARALQGVEKGTLIVDGGVLYSAYGTSAGTYFARGLAEYLFSRRLGLRFEGFVQFTDPNRTELKIRLSGAALGGVLHFLPSSTVDPYLLFNAGAAVTTGEGVSVAPSLSAGGGVNFHVGRAFLNLQAGYYFADLLLQRLRPSLNDLRVQAGLGFTFDLGR